MPNVAAGVQRKKRLTNNALLSEPGVSRFRSKAQLTGAGANRERSAE